MQQTIRGAEGSGGWQMAGCEADEGLGEEIGIEYQAEGGGEGELKPISQS